MKRKIVIIDGGPRRNMNTAQMAASFAEGVRSAGKDIELKQYRLYDIDYRGCMSCLGCKLKGKSSLVCVFKDGLKEVLDEISSADGLAIASPIYMGRNTAQTQAFLERLVFPWLSYNDFSLSVVKRMADSPFETQKAAGIAPDRPAMTSCTCSTTFRRIADGFSLIAA